MIDIAAHIDRIKAGANNVYNLQNLSSFVEKHLYLEGNKYTFGDKYGFQRHETLRDEFLKDYESSLAKHL